MENQKRTSVSYQAKTGSVGLRTRCLRIATLNMIRLTGLAADRDRVMDCDRHADQHLFVMLHKTESFKSLQARLDSTSIDFDYDSQPSCALQQHSNGLSYSRRDDRT